MSDQPSTTPPADTTSTTTTTTTATVETPAQANARYEAFLRDEIKRAKRGVAVTYTLGLIAAVLIIASMGLSLYSIREALEPRMLAGLIALRAEEEIPKMIEQAETALIDKAHDMSEEMDSRFKSLVPRFSQAGRDYIDQSYQEALPHLSEEFSVLIASSIDQNADQLREFAQAHDNEAFAAHFTDSVMDEFTQQLDQHFAMQYEGRDIAYFHENLTYSLLAMDETLTEILSADPAELDRRQQLQRRLLSHLFSAATEAPAQ
jgi:predicted lipid-binding transport protein (Tim44 family)